MERASQEENMEEEIVGVMCGTPDRALSQALDQRPPRPTTSTVAIRGLLVNDDGVFSTIRLPLNVSFVPYRLAMSRTTNG